MAAHHTKMSGLRAKLALFTDFRSYCGGGLLAILSDRRCKAASSLEIEKLHVCHNHLVICIRGTAELNRHINVVIVLDRLPRAEIENTPSDGGSNQYARRFLDRLVDGLVTELYGCLVLELQTPLSYINIFSSKSTTVDDLSVSLELTVFMLVDEYGNANCWWLDAQLPFSRGHHKWTHMVTLEIAKGCRGCNYSTTLVDEPERRIQFFDYLPEVGQIVFCDCDAKSAPSSSGTPVHLVRLCSLRFISKTAVELSRVMTLDSQFAVVNIHCHGAGFWILCADWTVAYYSYKACRTYTLSASYEVNQILLSTVGDVDAKVVTAVSSSVSVEGGTVSFYCLVNHTLMRFCWGEYSKIYLSGIHRLDRILRYKNIPEGQEIVLQDMHVAAETFVPEDGVTAVICVASMHTTYLLHVHYPAAPTYEAQLSFTRDVRRCVALSLPKLRASAKFGAFFIISPALQHTDDSALLYLCRGSSVFTISTVGSTNISNSHAIAMGGGYINFSDQESVISDGDAAEFNRTQVLS